jgi:hypothetical protein
VWVSGVRGKRSHRLPPTAPPHLAALPAGAGWLTGWCSGQGRWMPEPGVNLFFFGTVRIVKDFDIWDPIRFV